jgi:pyruvate kinase
VADELETNVDRIFGAPRPERRARIMVTAPTSAAANRSWAESVIGTGMDVARINTAHDRPALWGEMIRNIHDVDATIKVLMDLAGPKIRTGTAELSALKVRVERDARGVIQADPDTGQPGKRFRFRLGALPDPERLQNMDDAATIPLKDIDHRCLRQLSTQVLKTQFEALEEHELSTVCRLVELPGDRLNGSAGDLLAAFDDEPTALANFLESEFNRPLDQGVCLQYRDAGGERSREITVHCLIVECGVLIGLECLARRSTYFAADTPLSFEGAGMLASIASMPEMASKVLVRDGDSLLIRADADYLGHSAREDTPAIISTREPTALEFVKVGHPVLIDDGRISGVVEDIDRTADGKVDTLRVRIGNGEPTAIGEEPTVRKIGPEKGINFPDSQIALPALTATDAENLDFVLDEADMIGFSFVQSGADIVALRTAIVTSLMKRGMPDERIAGFLASKTVIAKIETRAAVDNLAEIIVAMKESGMQPGIMIARGDLAVEVGFDKLAATQWHLAQVSRQAGVPYIYATEVLKTLAKKGTPTRADMVDLNEATAGLEAPCVMLNKGAHIADAVAKVAALAVQHQANQRGRLLRG